MTVDILLGLVLDCGICSKEDANSILRPLLMRRHIEATSQPTETSDINTKAADETDDTTVAAAQPNLLQPDKNMRIYTGDFYEALVRLALAKFGHQKQAVGGDTGNDSGSDFGYSDFEQDDELALGLGGAGSHAPPADKLERLITEYLLHNCPTAADAPGRIRYENSCIQAYIFRQSNVRRLLALLHILECHKILVWNTF